jgi:polar amino acid transport system ATP-binding protein
MNDGAMADLGSPEEIIRKPISDRLKALLSRFHERAP